jgi:hypothetical protein
VLVGQAGAAADEEPGVLAVAVGAGLGLLAGALVTGAPAGELADDAQPAAAMQTSAAAANDFTTMPS